MGNRTIAAATLAELDNDSARPIAFVEIQLDGGTERFHTDVGIIAWGGNNWHGAGAMSYFEEITETDDLQPDPVRIGLNGFDSDITNMIDNEDLYRRPVLIYVGALNDSLALVADPSLIYSGRIQDSEMTMGAEGGDSVLLTLESELVDFDRPRNVRYTESQLQSEYSTDTGLQYLDQTVDSKTVWRGNNPVRLGSGGSIGGSIQDTIDAVRRGIGRAL